MEKTKPVTVEEIRRHPEIHTVWIDEAERIASFHVVDGYTAQTFSNHEFFLDYLRFLQEHRFRFQ